MLLLVPIPVDDLVSYIDKSMGRAIQLPKEQNTYSVSQEGKPIIIGSDGRYSFVFENEGTYFSMMYYTLLPLTREHHCDLWCFRFTPWDQNIELFSASDGSIRRQYIQRPCTFTEPYSVGEPLPTESEHPLSACDGSGLQQVLDGLGFRRMNIADGTFRLDGTEQTWYVRERGNLLLDDPLPQDFLDHGDRYGVPFEIPHLKLRYRVVDGDTSEICDL